MGFRLFSLFWRKYLIYVNFALSIWWLVRILPGNVFMYYLFNEPISLYIFTSITKSIITIININRNDFIATRTIQAVILHEYIDNIKLYQFICFKSVHRYILNYINVIFTLYSYLSRHSVYSKNSIFIYFVKSKIIILFNRKTTEYPLKIIFK